MKQQVLLFTHIRHISASPFCYLNIFILVFIASFFLSLIHTHIQTDEWDNFWDSKQHRWCVVTWSCSGPIKRVGEEHALHIQIHCTNSTSTSNRVSSLHVQFKFTLKIVSNGKFVKSQNKTENRLEDSHFLMTKRTDWTESEMSPTHPWWPCAAKCVTWVWMTLVACNHEENLMWGSGSGLRI